MIRINVPAKLNLFLHITGKRPDGYHLIESLAGFTEFGDAVELSEAPELSLDIDGPFAKMLKGDSGHNLVMRAAQALQQQAGVTRGARIRLYKHIPLGAGLGGGSSDAAATLKGLMQLWRLPLHGGDLLKLALSLGSDVPVCMAGRSAWVSGIGEQVAAVEIMAGGWLLLVNPHVPLLTADVYRRFSGGLSQASAPVASIETFSQLVGAMQSRRNDLEKPAVELLPVIADMLAALRATPGCAIARMSGSGSTCFALYEHEQAAQAAARQIRGAHPGWWGQVTTLLGQTYGKA